MRLISYSLLLVMFSNFAVAGGDPATGKSLSIICIGCHGLDGNSSNPAYPKLAGQMENYLIKQLNDFKTGARKEEHMTSMVEAIAVEDIPHIAAYFSSQKRTYSIDAKTINTQGKEIFHAGIKTKNIPACASCHGPKGMGDPIAKVPSLAGQHAEYITKSLKDFRSSERNNDLKMTMRHIASRISDKEIDALSSFITRLH